MKKLITLVPTEGKTAKQIGEETLRVLRDKKILPKQSDTKHLPNENEKNRLTNT